jgi:hypothetical protein
VRIVNQFGMAHAHPRRARSDGVKFIGEKGGGGRPTRQAWSKELVASFRAQ